MEAVKKKKNGIFSDKAFNRELVRLALPIAFQNLMLALVAAADALMLGGVNQNFMSAVSLATQPQTLQNMALSSSVSAIAVLGAQYWGKRDIKAVKNVIGIGMRFCAFFSILFFVLCTFFPRQLMTIFTNEQELIDIGIKYLKIAGWSYLLTGFSQCYLCVLKITDHASDAARISSVTVVLNIVLNAVFIFGFKMNAEGAAVATLISRIVELVWSFALSHSKTYVHISVKNVFARNRLLFSDYLKCVLPLLGASTLWSVGFASYPAFMGHLGTDVAAANSVAAVIRDIVCCLCNGVAYGGGIILGNVLGRGELERGKEYGIKLCKLGFVVGFASTIIMLACTPLLLAMVKLTDSATYYLLGMMVITAFYMIGRSCNTVMINGIFDSGGDTIFDMYSLVVTMWCMAVPLAALGTFVFHWSPFVVYAMTCLDEVGKIPWVLIHFRKYKWVRDLTRENV